MPNLTVPNVMVAAVAAIGLYAGYRLVKNKMDDVKPEGSGEGELVLLGNPLKLNTNRYYRGRLRVPNEDPALSSPTALATMLKQLGFSNVRVWSTDKELPSGWPSSTRANPGPATRWFEGQWRNTNVMLPRPADIESMWISKPPPGATYVASPAIAGAPCPPGKDCGCADCGEPRKTYLMRPAFDTRGPFSFNSSYSNSLR